MTQAPVPDSTLVEIVDNIFLPRPAPQKIATDDRAGIPLPYFLSDILGRL